MGSVVGDGFDQDMSTFQSRLLAALVVAALVSTGAVGGAAVAAGKIKGKQIARNAIASKHLRAGAVTGDKVAPNTLTGVQIDEASLGQVRDAATIAGTKVTPLLRVLPNTNPSPVPIATGPGWELDVDCDATQADVLLFKVNNTALVAGHYSTGNNISTFVLPGSGTPDTVSQYAAWHLVSITAGTATTLVDLTAAFSAGQFSSQTDCFFTGTITTTP